MGKQNRPGPVDITRETEVSGGWPPYPRIAYRNEAPGPKETRNGVLARRLYRDAACRHAPGARRRRLTELVSTPIPGSRMLDGLSLRWRIRWRLSYDRAGLAWASGTPLLLLLLTRLSAQFSLFFSLVVVLSGHGPSGNEAIEGERPERRNGTQISAGLRTGAAAVGTCLNHTTFRTPERAYLRAPTEGRGSRLGTWVNGLWMLLSFRLDGPA